MEVQNNRKASFWTEEKGDATLLFSFMVILINDRVVTMELFLDAEAMRKKQAAAEQRKQEQQGSGGASGGK
ncbi:hypothetical protein EB796_020329 [Bugula neritina]|uniref:Uncharacterized protein n=1 Tax=Bugula neritina TaxID=10212 RepID=A0A7J7J6K1_BUGNE|nr:hypothetical protein EB796_020329 [Bugula neritina]